MPIRLPYDKPDDQTIENPETKDNEKDESEIRPTFMGKNSSVTSMKKEQSIKKL